MKLVLNFSNLKSQVGRIRFMVSQFQLMGHIMCKHCMNLLVWPVRSFHGTFLFSCLPGRFAQHWPVVTLLLSKQLSRLLYLLSMHQSCFMRCVTFHTYFERGLVLFYSVTRNERICIVYICWMFIPNSSCLSGWTSSWCPECHIWLWSNCWCCHCQSHEHRQGIQIFLLVFFLTLPPIWFSTLENPFINNVRNLME